MSSAPPVISVCIANYNGIGLIDDCIASVRDQTLVGCVEIIVHDDASSDDSVTHIRAHYPDVYLIESPENCGFCIANNRMAAIARGRYLLLLNNDATLMPDALAVFLEEAAKLDAPSILTLPQYDAMTGELLDIGSRLDLFMNTVPNREPGREIGMVAGACLWIDRSLWDQMDGFPPWFVSLAEDLYLCCRARLAGQAVRALGVSGYRHRVGMHFGGGRLQDGRLQSTYRRRALTERNKTFVMAMVYPLPLFLAIFPLHLLLLLVEGILLSLLKRRAAYLKRIYLPVFGDLWKYRRQWWEVRTHTQQSRRLASTDFLSAFDWLPYKLRMLARYGLPHLD
jgi:GT2 family glycosyltransferase